MSDESFYGVTLSGEGSKVEWEVLSNDEDFPRGQKLIIRQILLGAEAKEDEFNVVEVHTVKDNLKIPIAVLKAGETRAVNPDIEFYETSATFKLIKGNGPVYIHGQNIKDEVEVVDMDDDESDEEDDGEEEEDEAQPQKKKQKMENNADGKNAKNKKK
ncbi:nucleoplasmin-like protein [Stomoxys calcitrans]|uniref:Nucleoplasmin core domain-containing protein n=1 Tax=Stomoxys calcitrans TaxID=35570 RepID=A0A1I8PBS8_STOCA|nr:nucleoplasmin-like protein [Stomoxys calcitrans]